jgi:hypothetical protein
MPVNAQDSGANRLLDVLGYPPVVVFLEIADGDQTSTAADRKLVLYKLKHAKLYSIALCFDQEDRHAHVNMFTTLTIGRELDARGSTVNAQDHQRWYPDKVGHFVVSLGLVLEDGCLLGASALATLPDVGVTVLAASHKLVGVGCPVDGSDTLSVLDETMNVRQAGRYMLVKMGTFGHIPPA